MRHFPVLNYTIVHAGRAFGETTITAQRFSRNSSAFHPNHASAPFFSKRLKTAGLLAAFLISLILTQEEKYEKKKNIHLLLTRIGWKSWSLSPDDFEHRRSDRNLYQELRACHDGGSQENPR